MKALLPFFILMFAVATHAYCGDCGSCSDKGACSVEKSSYSDDDAKSCGSKKDCGPCVGKKMKASCAEACEASCTEKASCCGECESASKKSCEEKGSCKSSEEKVESAAKKEIPMPKMACCPSES